MATHPLRPAPRSLPRPSSTNARSASSATSASAGATTADSSAVALGPVVSVPTATNLSPTPTSTPEPALARRASTRHTHRGGANARQQRQSQRASVIPRPVHTVKIGRLRDGTGVAQFSDRCATCLLAAQCTTSGLGRKVRVGVNEAALARARATQADPKWRADYRQTRPKVERKLGHLMRRRHGGRRARVRGKLRVGADFSLLSAAANLARLATLGARSTEAGGWAVAR